MASKKISDRVKETHIQMLHKLGERGLYERAVGAGMLQSSKTKHPEVSMLDLSEAFFALYRRTGDDDYATVSRVLRKAAHTVYRELMRQENATPKPIHAKRFLTLCS